LDDQARSRWVATHILPHEGEVRGWVRRHVHHLTPADIDDLVQEAYARLLIVEFTHIANGRSYLFTVVRNLLFEQARRARTVPMELMGQIEALRVPTEEPGPESRVGVRQELERLERIVAALPKQCRRAFELQKFYGLSQREIAREMKITEKAVEKHLAAALLRVLDAVKGDSDSAQPKPGPGMSRHDTQQSKD
jgi:RNA polymerase sigma-70 factor (ECF subfamily)